MDRAIPDVLVHTVAEIERQMRIAADKHRATLTAAQARFKQEIAAEEAAVRARSPLLVRPCVLGAARARADLVAQALQALEPEALAARLRTETEACLVRFRDLEAQEEVLQAEHLASRKDVDLQFLPDAQHQTESFSRKDHAAACAQELRVRFGVEDRPVDLVPFDQCPTCGVAMQYNTALQQLVCAGCGQWKRFADMTSAALAFGEELQFCKYSYHPITHLDDTIRNAEAGEAALVPPHFLLLVMQELYRRGIKPEQVSIHDIRSVIYDNNKREHARTAPVAAPSAAAAADGKPSKKTTKSALKVDNAVQIYCRLTGRTPYRLSSYAKDQMRIMFFTEEPHYRKFRQGRTNNLSYTYKGHYYCYLLGYWEMLASFPLLRGNANLQAHDVIQKQISGVLDWEFTPTIRHQDNHRVLNTLRKTGIMV